MRAAPTHPLRPPIRVITPLPGAHLCPKAAPGEAVNAFVGFRPHGRQQILHCAPYQGPGEGGHGPEETPGGRQRGEWGGGGSFCRPFGGLGGFWGPMWVLGGDFQGSPRSPCGSLGGCEIFGAFMGVLPGVLGPYRGAWRSLGLVKGVRGVRMGSWGSPCGCWGGLWGWVEGSRGVSGSLRWSVRDPGGQRGVAGGSQRWMKGSRGSQRGHGGGLGGGSPPQPRGHSVQGPIAVEEAMPGCRVIRRHGQHVGLQSEL